MIKWCFAVTWQQPKCTQLSSKYFIFNNIVWTAAAARSRRQHTNTCVHLLCQARSLSPQNTTSALVPALILGPFLLMKVSPQRKTVSSALVSSVSLDSFTLKEHSMPLLQPLPPNSPSWNKTVWDLSRFSWGWKDIEVIQNMQMDLSLFFLRSSPSKRSASSSCLSALSMLQTYVSLFSTSFSRVSFSLQSLYLIKVLWLFSEIKTNFS